VRFLSQDFGAVFIAEVTLEISGMFAKKRRDHRGAAARDLAHAATATTITASSSLGKTGLISQLREYVGTRRGGPSLWSRPGRP
jgi:hypothetical protein